MCACGWFTLLCGRIQHSIAKQLQSNKSQFKKKKQTLYQSFSVFTLTGKHLSTLSFFFYGMYVICSVVLFSDLQWIGSVMHMNMKVLATQSCLTLYNLMDQAPLSMGKKKKKNTGVGSHPLLQGISLIQGLYLGSPILQADSLSSAPPGSPQMNIPALSYLYSFPTWAITES